MTEPTGQAVYRIIIQGCLDRMWADWFEGLAIDYDRAGNTILAGPIVDQSALHGVLARIRNLNLTLISVDRVEGKPETRQGEQ